MRRALLFSIALAIECPAALAQVTATSLSPKKVLSVCQALDRIADLDGKEVAIRGQWILGLEQVGIYPFRCKRRERTG